MKPQSVTAWGLLLLKRNVDEQLYHDEDAENIRFDTENIIMHGSKTDNKRKITQR